MSKSTIIPLRFPQKFHDYYSESRSDFLFNWKAIGCQNLIQKSTRVIQKLDLKIKNYGSEYLLEIWVKNPGL